MACGIPLDEVYSYINSGLDRANAANWQLYQMAQESLKKSLKKLGELARGGEREGKHFESTDLEAAKALAKFAIDALKLARAGAAAKPDGKGQPDLFDSPGANPWDLKKTE